MTELIELLLYCERAAGSGRQKESGGKEQSGGKGEGRGGHRLEANFQWEGTTRSSGRYVASAAAACNQQRLFRRPAPFASPIDSPPERGLCQQPCSEETHEPPPGALQLQRGAATGLRPRRPKRRTGARCPPPPPRQPPCQRRYRLSPPAAAALRSKARLEHCSKFVNEVVVVQHNRKRRGLGDRLGKEPLLQSVSGRLQARPKVGCALAVPHQMRP